MKSYSKKIIYQSWMALSMILACSFADNIAQAVPPPPGQSSPPPSSEASIPPAQNPHPPQTEAEKKRVQFAETATKLLLAQELPQKILDKGKGLATAAMFASGDRFKNKTLTQLQSSSYDDDSIFVTELISIHQNYGLAVETKHAHIVPWSWENFKNSQAGSSAVVSEPKDSASMPHFPSLGAGEFIVHIYAKFDSQNPFADGWYHLNAILTENEKGEIFLRRFIVYPLEPKVLPPC